MVNECVDDLTGSEEYQIIAVWNYKIDNNIDTWNYKIAFNSCVGLGCLIIFTLSVLWKERCRIYVIYVVCVYIIFNVKKLFKICNSV